MYLRNPNRPVLAESHYAGLNLLDTKNDDIAYYYASRLPGEPASGVNGTHFHPAEPFEVRASLTYHF
jgi:hypothetical protein